MGELKRYQEAGFQYQAMPTFTTASTDEALASNQRLNRFLSEASQVFGQKAEEYATDQAIEDAIRNPITKEQIDQARKTGGNPITEFLKGGTIYNEAIKKVLGQQVAGELRLEFDAINAQALDDVRLGNITNPEQLLSKLKEPIQAHVEFLTQIDPELAEGYGARATATARSNYLQGGDIFRNQQEEKAQFNAETMSINMERDYGNYLIANPNATIEQRQLYRDIITQSAIDTSFSMSRNQLKLIDQLNNKLDNAEDRFAAKKLAEKYPNRTIGEVLDLIKKDDSSLAAHYKNKSLEDKKSFEQKLNNELTIESSRYASIQRENARLIKQSKVYFDAYQPISPALISKIDKNIIPGTEQAEEWEEVKRYSERIEDLNKTSIIDINTQLSALQDKILNVAGPSATIQDFQEYSLLSGYAKNLDTGLKNDYIGTILKRHGVYERLDFSDPDTLKQQIEKRRVDLDTYGVLYGLPGDVSQREILSQNEVNAFLSMYSQGDGQLRVGMLNSLNDGLGDLEANAMSQLVKSGLPLTAELSSFFNNPMLTEKFLSFDNEDEQKRLKQALKDKTNNAVTFDELRSKIRGRLSDFESVVMMGNNYDSSRAIEKMDNLLEVLTYNAINEIVTNNKGTGTAWRSSADLIADSFHVEDTYYIPKIYNGEDISHMIDADGGIVAKANLIKDEYLMKFQPVPFGSGDPNVSEKQLSQEMFYQMKENGEWRNTPDGTGLIFGIVMSDGSFAPIVNKDNEFLTFKFNDTSMTLPGTDHQMKDLSRNVEIGFGLNPEYYKKK